MRKRVKTNRGVALVAVMWIVLLAGLLLLGVNRAAAINLALAHNELTATQARWLARAGVEQALAILDDDKSSVDSPLDWWYEDTASFEEVELPTGKFSVIAPAAEQSPTVPRYGLLDLNSRVNAGTTAENQLAAIPDITPGQVDSIIDWRDGDENPRPAGAERGYYQRLDFPYEIANRPPRTHAELLLVQGIDASAFYGEDTDGDGVLGPGEDTDRNGAMRTGLLHWTAVESYERNEDAAGLPRVNLKNADPAVLKERLKFSDALISAFFQYRGQRGQMNSVLQILEVRAPGPPPQARPSPTGDDEEVSQITPEWLAENIDKLTVKGEEVLPARVNINTAPRQVLMTLPGMTADAADAIVSYRDSSKGPFTSPGELLIGNTVEPRVARSIVELVTVRSNVFRVTSVGTAASGAVRTVTAVVDRDARPPILYWHESE